MTWRKGNRLQIVKESQALGPVREIYEDIKQTLGLPYINVVYEVFGSYPKFLELHWQVMKPVLQTKCFFELAERVRADAYTRMHNYFDVPDLCARTTSMQFSPGAQQELSETVDLFQYTNPILLLITTAQLQAFDGPVGDANADRIPAQHPVFERKPITLDEDSAPAPTRKIFDDIKRSSGIPVVTSDYRAFARWPDFLRSYWETLKASRESPLYQQSIYAIREDAWNLVRELPGPIEITVAQLAEAGMDDDDIASIVRLNELFVDGLSSMVLNIALAKIGMEGGNLHTERKSETEPTQAA